MKEQEVHVPHAATAVPRLAPSRVRRASWGAIFAGVFVTIVLQVMFMLLGAAIGLASLQPAQDTTSGRNFGLGAGIWLLVTGLISTWIGACIAGRLSGGPRRADGMLHGIVTWSVATVTAFVLLTTAVGTVVGGAGALLGGALSGGALAQSRQGSQGPLAAIENQVGNAFPQANALLPPTGRTEGQTVPGQLTALAAQDSELAMALGRMERNGGAAQAPGDRDQVVNILTTKHQMDQEQAVNLVNQWDQQFRQAHAQAVQQTRQAAQTAAHGAAQGALWGFIALLLGLICAAWGGWAGVSSLPRPTEAAAVAT
jgi:hypothetical protein